MSGGEKKVIGGSSPSTVFASYIFCLYGSLAAVIGAKFFSHYDETTRNIFALLAFAAGFLARPCGASEQLHRRRIPKAACHHRRQIQGNDAAATVAGYRHPSAVA